MSLEFEGVYDGSVIRPDEPLDFKPDTRLRFVVQPLGANEPIKIEKGEPYSFLDVLASANLDGPADWSENINKYLTGELQFPEE